MVKHNTTFNRPYPMYYIRACFYVCPLTFKTLQQVISRIVSTAAYSNETHLLDLNQRPNTSDTTCVLTAAGVEPTLSFRTGMHRVYMPALFAAQPSEFFRLYLPCSLWPGWAKTGRLEIPFGVKPNPTTQKGLHLGDRFIDFRVAAFHLHCSIGDYLVAFNHGALPNHEHFIYYC